MNLRSVILIAGRGTRLWPITTRTPKCLLPVGGRSLLGYSIDNLLSVGVRSFVIVVGFEAQQICQYIRQSFPALSVIYVYNDKFRESNSLYSYFLAIPHFLHTNYFRLDGDVLYSRQILHTLLSSPNTPVCTVEKKPRISPEEYTVAIDNTGHIIRLGKNIADKAVFGEAKGIEFVSDKQSHNIVSSLRTMVRKKKLQSFAFAEEAYQYLISKGEHIYYVKLQKNDFWCEVDTETDLVFANNNIHKITV